MKNILVCTDGSEQSLKAIEEAIKIANGCNTSDVAVINVIERVKETPIMAEGYLYTKKEMEDLRELAKHRREEQEKILAKAIEIFKKSNITATPIAKEGHPAGAIAEEASENDYDLVIVGSRGLGGLKKLLLGSVSNSVVQEVETNVLVVK